MPPTLKSLGIDRLSVTDRMRLVEEIWESIESSWESVPAESAAAADESVSIEIPDWHKKIIDERIADCEANPDSGTPWEEVRARLRASMSRSSD
jgi:putative addiction module component (TIGR02574 family)